MSAKVELSAEAAAFRAEFLDVLSRSPMTSTNAVLIMAQMQAAARLFPHATRDIPIGFFDPDRELTTHDWRILLSAVRASENNAGRLPVLHRLGSERGGFQPPDILFEDREGRLTIVEVKAHRAEDDPGTLERLRRILLRRIPRPNTDANRPEVPSWLLHAMSTLAAETRTNLFVPHDDVQDLLCALMAPVLGRSIYCAFEGTASIALRLAREGAERVAFEVPNETAAEFVYCLAVAHNLPLAVRVAHPITDLPLGDEIRCDAAVAVPPFGMRYNADLVSPRLPREHAADALHLLALMHRTQGALACAIGDGFLSRSAQAERYFKEEMVKAGGISAVVSLPRGAFPTANLRTSIVYRGPVRSRTPGEVLFVDARRGDDGRRRSSVLPSGRIADLVRGQAEDDQSIIVDLQHLLENDFNMTAERYVLDQATLEARAALSGAQTVLLGDVAEITRPQTLTQIGEDGVPFREVLVADIDPATGAVHLPSRRVMLSPETAARARRAALEPGDLVLSIKGRIGAVGIVEELPPGDETWVPGQSFAVIRLRRGAAVKDPRILYRYLVSPLGQNALQTLAGGTTVPFVQIADVRRLEVPLPSPTDIIRLRKAEQEIAELNRQLSAIKGQIAKVEGKLWPMNLIGLATGGR
jgi:type I restriction enzyme M protein